MVRQQRIVKDSSRLFSQVITYLKGSSECATKEIFVDLPSVSGDLQNKRDEAKSS